jgi:hypothetical protein
MQFAGGSTQVNASYQSFIDMSGSTFSVTGGATSAFMSANGQSMVRADSTTITFVGNPGFGVVMDAEYGGIMSLATTFAGAATGARYNIVFNAGIQTYTSGNPNAIPGSSAGSLGASCFYQ